MGNDFNTAFKEVIGHEGGFSIDPVDNGNWTGGKQGVGELKGTKFGIAANTYPHLDIKNLTVEQAKEIYRKDFWERGKIDLLPIHLRGVYFNFSINMGRTGAAKILQKAAGVRADGIIGTQTLTAANDVSLERFLLFAYDRYMRIIGARPANARFAKGWSNRVLSFLS